MILLSYQDQALAEQVAWHKANNPQLIEKQLKDFEAGFHDGWRQCVSTINLHKITL
jgi:hypothetical protein